MDAIGLTHFFTHFRKLGGVESILRNHLVQDQRWGLPSRILAFFEPQGELSPNVSGLGLSWRDCVVSARWKMRRAAPRIRSEIALYHNFWGIPFLADLDGCRRRVALLHSDWPGIERGLRAQRGLVDGVMCVNAVLKAQVQEAIPALGDDRVFVVPLPIDSPKREVLHTPMSGRPIVCGFSGRVVKEQKRVDRMAELCRKLDVSGLDYRLEILGDGADREWLQGQLAGNKRVQFHGRQSGERYWEILSQWDVIFFLSDYEGLPISLLEAFSCGVLPLFPRIGSGGDGYVEKVNPDFLYTTEDFDRAARILAEIKQAPENQIADLRRTCKLLAAPHEGDAYYRSFAEFIARISESRRMAPEALPRRPLYWSDYLPFGLMRRAYYRGFYRRNDGW
jgi:glycosyltransferase involved in cell wall biosynthesis